MLLIIVGGGRVGEELIKFADRIGAEVRVIEKNSSRCAELSRKYPIKVYQGDGSEARILEAAGAREADVLIACTDDDEVNAKVASLAKKMFYVPHVIARTNSMLTPVDMFKDYADVVIRQGELLVEAIKKHIVGGNTELIYDKGEIAIVRVKPPADSPLIGAKLDKYYSTGELMVIKLERGLPKLLGKDDSIMYGGDYLIIGKRDTVLFLLSFALPSATRASESSGV